MRSKDSKNYLANKLFVIVLLCVPGILLGAILYGLLRERTDSYFDGMDIQFVGVIEEMKELGRYDLLHLNKVYSNKLCYEKDKDSKQFFCLIDNSHIDVVCSANYLEIGDTLKCVIDDHHCFLHFKGKDVDRTIAPYVPFLEKVTKDKSFIYPLNCLNNDAEK